MRVSKILPLICFAFLLVPVPSTALPTMDGIITGSEWESAESHVIELTTGNEITLSIIYTQTTVYYLATVDHSAEVNKINLDPSKPHDYFGLEFDNNKDDAIMGTEDSPDDTIMVNYKENTAADMFMHSYKAFYDTDYGGTDDTEGKAGTDGEMLIFEFSKPMKSDDPLGHDYDLIQGSEYQIMVGFWDDQPPHSAIAGFNKRVDNDQFLTLRVNEVVSTLPLEIITFVVFLSALGASYFVTQKGIKSVRSIKLSNLN